MSKPHELTTSDIPQLSAFRIKDLLDRYKTVSFDFLDKDNLIIYSSSGEFATLGKVMYIAVSYGEYTEEFGSPGYYAVGTEYFDVSAEGIDLACLSFMTRLRSDKPSKRTEAVLSLDSIAELQKQREQP